MSPDRSRRREHGAVVTVVAVLLAGGVLLGFLALSLDVGQILVEKRQLQNSADAAADVAGQVVRQEQLRGRRRLAGQPGRQQRQRQGLGHPVAVRAPTCRAPRLPACATGSGAWADCSPLPPALAAMTGLPYVEVRTRTQTANGAGRNNFMKNWIAGLNGNSTTSSAGACARAAVGTPADVHQRAADHLLGLRLAARHRRHHRRRRRVLLPLARLQRRPTPRATAAPGSRPGRPPPRPRRRSSRARRSSCSRRTRPAGPPCRPAARPGAATPCPAASASWRPPSDPCKFVEYPLPLDAHRHRQQHLVQPERAGRQGHQPADLRLHQHYRPRRRSPRSTGAPPATAATPTTTAPGTPSSTSAATASTSPAASRTRSRAWSATSSRAPAATAASPAGSSRASSPHRPSPVRPAAAATSAPTPSSPPAEPPPRTQLTAPLLPEGHSSWVDASSPSRRQRSSR